MDVRASPPHVLNPPTVVAETPGGEDPSRRLLVQSFCLLTRLLHPGQPAYHVDYGEGSRLFVICLGYKIRHSAGAVRPLRRREKEGIDARQIVRDGSVTGVTAQQQLTMICGIFEI